MDDSKKPAPGAGDVEIVLVEGGEERTHRLVPSLGACMHLSRAAGGIAGAVDRVGRLDFDTIVEVVAVGLGVNPSQKEKLVQPAVYETGLIMLSAPCISFLHVVANGGRAPVSGEQDGEDEDRDPLASESQSENTTAD